MPWRPYCVFTTVRYPYSSRTHVTCEKAFLARVKHSGCALIHHVVSLWQCLFLYYNARHLPATKSSSTCYPHGYPNGVLPWHSHQRLFSPPQHSRLRPFGVGPGRLGKLCSDAANSAILTASHQLPLSPCNAPPCTSYSLPSMVQRCE
jgi:hypothetical protein